MSITNIRNLGISEAEDELFGHRNYTWIWQVETDDPKEAPDVIVNDNRFIQRGWPLISAEFSDPRALLVKLRTSKDKNDPRIVLFTQQFSTNIKFPSGDAGSSTGPGSGGNGVTPATWPLNPLLQPASIRGYYIREMEPIEEDLRPDKLGGPQPIVNSIGEPLTPPIELARKLPAIAVGINKATIDERMLFDMQDAINDGPWRGLPTGTVKAECEWHSEYDAQFGPYWHLDWVFVYNSRGWTPTRFLNVSFNKREVVPGGGAPTRYKNVPIRDNHGQPVATPQRIDINGVPVDPPIIRSGVVTTGSAVITGLSSTSDLAAAYYVRGEGIPKKGGFDAFGFLIAADTLILSVDSASQITLTANATATGSFELTFLNALEHWLEFWLYHRQSFGTLPF